MSSPILYERHKRVHDRTVRCYLTLDCPLACGYCSAGVPGLAPARRRAWQPPEFWAAGINRRGRHTVLGGGEPLAYRGIGALIRGLDRRIRVSLYTNAVPPVAEVLAAGRPLEWLISWHPGTPDRDRWLAHVRAIRAAGDPVRFHIVKRTGWRDDFTWLRRQLPAVRITACDDQRGGPKSRPPVRRVRCTCDCELYGPEGRRYPCITLMGRGEQPQESLSDPDGPDGFTVSCGYFGSCVGCDNNIEGIVTEKEPC